MPYTISYAALKDKAFRDDIIRMFSDKAYDAYFSAKNGPKMRGFLIGSLIGFMEMDENRQNMITDVVTRLMNQALGEEDE
jgi:hypothetical protein